MICETHHEAARTVPFCQAVSIHTPRHCPGMPMLSLRPAAYCSTAVDLHVRRSMVPEVPTR